jgi:hypothetical protein
MPRARSARTGIDHDAERGDRVGVAVHPAQGIAHRGAQVGAAADRLGDEDVRAGAGGKPLRGVDQRVEAAAEAAAGDLLDREAVRGQHGGVDEADALVVRDQADAAAVAMQCLRQAQDCGGLPGPQEAANHDVTGRCHALQGLDGIMTDGPGRAKPKSTVPGWPDLARVNGLRATWRKCYRCWRILSMVASSTAA